MRIVATDQAAFQLSAPSVCRRIHTTRDSTYVFGWLAGCRQMRWREDRRKTHYEVMDMQIFWPTSNRPEGVNSFTSGALNAASQVSIYPTCHLSDCWRLTQESEWGDER